MSAEVEWTATDWYKALGYTDENGVFHPRPLGMQMFLDRTDRNMANAWLPGAHWASVIALDDRDRITMSRGQRGAWLACSIESAFYALCDMIGLSPDQIDAEKPLMPATDEALSRLERYVARHGRHA